MRYITNFVKGDCFLEKKELSNDDGWSNRNFSHLIETHTARVS